MNFEKSQSTIGKVMGKSRVSCFFTHWVCCTWLNMKSPANITLSVVCDMPLPGQLSTESVSKLL